MLENARRPSWPHLGGWLLALGAGIIIPGGAQAAAIIAPAFAADYTITDLGPDKTQDVTALGVASSQAALQFVPSTFGGAGEFKGLSWSGGEFYTFTIAADGTGTFDVTSATQETTLGGGPEGFIYIKNTNP